MVDIEKLVQTSFERYEKVNAAIVVKFTGDKGIGMSEPGMKSVLRPRKSSSFRELGGV